jgi:hypothetical protein
MIRLKAVALALAATVSIPGAAFAITLSDVAGVVGQVDPASALSSAESIAIQPLSELDNVPEGIDELNAALAANAPDAAALQSEVAENDVIEGELDAQGFAPEDVVAIADAGGAVTLFVNDLGSASVESGLSAAPAPVVEDEAAPGIPESIFND